jgi:ketopantoate reductase
VNAGDLQSVIERVPRERRSDLVFVQNGMLDTFLDEHVCGANTRGLLYFAVPKLGADVQPGGASVFTGLHSDAIVDWFQRLGLEGRAVGRGEFSNQMASKLIWNCTFGLLCDVHDEPVDSVVAKHRDDVALLVSDLVQISNGAIGTTLGATDTTVHLLQLHSRVQGHT